MRIGGQLRINIDMNEPLFNDTEYIQVFSLNRLVQCSRYERLKPSHTFHLDEMDDKKLEVRFSFGGYDAFRRSNVETIYFVLIDL